MADKRRQHHRDQLAFDHTWGSSSNEIWLATTLTLHRNIDKFHFPHRLESAKRNSVSTLIAKTLEGSPSLDAKTLSTLFFDDLEPKQREYFFEHFLVFEHVRDALKGKVVMCDAQGDISLSINFSDHVQLHALDLTSELEKSFERLIAIDHHIEKKLPYAYNDRFGYLTSDPTSCGTALKVRAFIHAPALIATGKINEILEEDKQEIIAASGIQGTSDEMIGDIALIYNRWTIGVTEEVILSSVRKEALKLTMHERSVRTKILQEKDPYIIDKISRALGVLKHSFSMDTSEALKMLSMIKFGIELGWICGMDVTSINQLLFLCRRAHLIEHIEHSLGKKALDQEAMTPEKLYVYRAELLRKKMEPLSLTVM